MTLINPNVQISKLISRSGGADPVRFVSREYVKVHDAFKNRGSDEHPPPPPPQVRSCVKVEVAVLGSLP